MGDVSWHEIQASTCICNPCSPPCTWITSHKYIHAPPVMYMDSQMYKTGTHTYRWYTHAWEGEGGEVSSELGSTEAWTKVKRQEWGFWTNVAGCGKASWEGRGEQITAGNLSHSGRASHTHTIHRASTSALMWADTDNIYFIWTDRPSRVLAYTQPLSPRARLQHRAAIASQSWIIQSQYKSNNNLILN